MNLRTAAARTLAVAALATGMISGTGGAANAADTFAAGSWPIVNSSGETVSHLNWQDGWAPMACYGRGTETVRIEGRYASGDNLYRIIDWRGCNIMPESSGGFALVEVRGVVGNGNDPSSWFTNPWHPFP
jgi:hypothetical protein